MVHEQDRITANDEARVMGAIPGDRQRSGAPTMQYDQAFGWPRQHAVLMLTTREKLELVVYTFPANCGADADCLKPRRTDSQTAPPPEQGP